MLLALHRWLGLKRRAAVLAVGRRWRLGLAVALLPLIAASMPLVVAWPQDYEAALLGGAFSTLLVALVLLARARYVYWVATFESALRDAASGRAMAAVDVVVALFRHRGYSVEKGPGCWLLSREGRRIGLSIRTDTRPLTVDRVRDFHQRLATLRAEHGYIVNPGIVTEDARLYEKDHAGEIHVIDGEKLQEMLLNARREVGGANPAFKALALQPPPCPLCGEAMMLRRPAKKRRYWGCSTWPLCGGRREMSAYDKRAANEAETAE